jgi:hypothetical protein
MTNKAKMIPDLSALLLSLDHDVKEYQTRFLQCDPGVAQPYRYMGLYRLLNSPTAEFINSTWFAQAVIETEMLRDNVEINTADQLDEYVNDFMQKLETFNPGFISNTHLRVIVERAFNNIYDAKGFNDEA